MTRTATQQRNAPRTDRRLARIGLEVPVQDTAHSPTRPLVNGDDAGPVRTAARYKRGGPLANAVGADTNQASGYGDQGSRRKRSAIQRTGCGTGDGSNGRHRGDSRLGTGRSLLCEGLDLSHRRRQDAAEPGRLFSLVLAAASKHSWISFWDISVLQQT